MTENEPGQVPKSPQDARLDSLEERLQRAQSREAERTGQTQMTDANEQLGQRVRVAACAPPERGDQPVGRVAALVHLGEDVTNPLPHPHGGSP